MKLVEKTCYACKGRRFFESWTGMCVACITCNGSGVVMEPSEEDARRMMEAVIAKHDRS